MRWGGMKSRRMERGAAAGFGAGGFGAAAGFFVGFGAAAGFFLGMARAGLLRDGMMRRVACGLGRVTRRLLS